jgi:cation:H+ antiporter
MIDQELTQFDGIVLIAAFFLYVWRIISQEKKFRDRLPPVPKSEFLLHTVIALVSLAFIYFFSVWVVKTAVLLSEELSLPLILIGMFFISFGTTLPEFTFETKSILTRHRYMALGDIIGNVVARSTLVLGATALIAPIQADYLLFLTSAFFMLIVAFLFMTLIDVEKHILVQEGIALIILYILFIVIELNIRVLKA